MPFDYSSWRTYSYGRARKPEAPRAQWTAWISAGGQHDAVVCHANSKEDVLALRRHIVSSMRDAADKAVYGDEG